MRAIARSKAEQSADSEPRRSNVKSLSSAQKIDALYFWSVARARAFVSARATSGVTCLSVFFSFPLSKEFLFWRPYSTFACSFACTAARRQRVRASALCGGLSLALHTTGRPCYYFAGQTHSFDAAADSRASRTILRAAVQVQLHASPSLQQA